MEDEKNTDPPADSPFGAGRLDAHQVVEIRPEIQALSDAQAEKVLNELEAALKEKRAMGQIKQALQVGLDLGKKLGIKGLTGI